MPTSLPSGVDPLLYSHPLSLRIPNVQYGSHPDMRLNYYKNANRSSGGNALLVLVHGGSWKANDKTLFAESTSGAGLGVYWSGYLLNSPVQGTDRIYFDVMSVEYSARAHEGINSDYERWHDDTTYGQVGSPSRRTYLQEAIRCVQRAVQHAKRNASFYDINVSRIFLLGHSVGGNTCLGAAHTPSRGWDPNRKGRWAAHHDSRVAGVINLSAEVDLDPWYMFHRHAKFCAGLIESNITSSGVRGDIERLFLVPDASGLYPQGQPKTDICKALSPVDLIAGAPRYLATTRIRSYYWKDHNASGPYAPPGTYEETTVPAGDYVAVPPYDASGHDWRQFAAIEAACVANDAARGDTLRKHFGRVLDAADYYPTPVGFHAVTAPNGISILGAHESMLAETYDWMCDLMEGIEPVA